jgi:hypothetical protein
VKAPAVLSAPEWKSSLQSFKNSRGLSISTYLFRHIGEAAPGATGPSEGEIVMAKKSTILTAKWLQSVLQPRVAMALAMTILSFTIVERCTGISMARTQRDEFIPAKIWTLTENKLVRFKDRAVKYYENVRIVYQFEHCLNEWEKESKAADPQTAHPTISALAAGASRGALKNRPYFPVSCP